MSDQKSVLAAATAVEAVGTCSGVGGVTSSSTSGAKDGGVGGGGGGEGVASSSPIQLVPPLSETTVEIHMTENMTEIEQLVVEATELAAWHDGVG